MVHSWKETGEIPKSRAGLTLKKKIEFAGVKREELWQYGLHEVPLAYNVHSGEVEALVLPLPSAEKDEWKRAFGDDWITGTADYVGILLELPWVDDLKTGRKADYESYKYQQAFYTLAWTLFQVKGLSPARSTITHWPKYRLDTKPSRYGTLLEPEFLADFQGRLKRLHADVFQLREKQEQGMDISGRLHAGGQCNYCPSKPNCTKGQMYERD
jgi:hypothetical protein